ncbi:F-box protein [Tripterygium wilfordii]|uniref:F-box protein n=1 Tax=Tripterygium wilfordii TaxID=458696 RepID=A0A7J7CMM6_TRIWF|nr:F-box protein [Tripterygium wilfordii]
MRNWAELPQDVLLVILQKLIIGKDYHRFAFVCRSWTGVVVNYLERYAPSGSPCLIVPAPGIASKSKSRRLLASPVGKDIDKEQDFLPQVRVPLQDVYIGSHQGWLIMLTDAMGMYLLNPISDTRINLPEIWLLELNNIYRYTIAMIYLEPMWPRLSFCRSKVILSTIPTASDCFVLLIYGYKKLAFCKPSPCDICGPSLDQSIDLGQLAGPAHPKWVVIFRSHGLLARLQPLCRITNLTPFN